MTVGFSPAQPIQTPLDASGDRPNAKWVPWLISIDGVVKAITTAGTTANRPTKNLFIGQVYFDTDLGTPIWLQSIKPDVWVPASGGGGGGGSIVSSLTITGNNPNAFLYSNASKAVVTTSNPQNGQLLIGVTGASPQLGYITGTANQVIVTNLAGQVHLQLPQNIGMGSSPQFQNLTLTGSETIAGFLTISSNTANAFTYSDATKRIRTTTAATDGQLLIGDTGSIPVKNTLTAGSGIGITNGAGTITIDNTGVLSITAGTNITIDASVGDVTINAVPSGTDTDVQFNDGGVFGGDTNFQFDKNIPQLTLFQSLWTSPSDGDLISILPDISGDGTTNIIGASYTFSSGNLTNTTTGDGSGLANLRIIGPYAQGPSGGPYYRGSNINFDAGGITLQPNALASGSGFRSGAIEYNVIPDILSAGGPIMFGGTVQNSIGGIDILAGEARLDLFLSPASTNISTNEFTGGSIVLSAGDTVYDVTGTPLSAYGASLAISGATDDFAGTRVSGDLTISTNNIERLKIDKDGAWQLATDPGTSGQVITSQGAGSPPTWNTPSVFTSPLTTKGDIFGYDTADARIPVGADGYVLTADSGDSLGVSWQPASTGTVTSVDVSGGTTGLTTSGGPVTTSGTITLAGVLVEANGGTNQSTYATGDILYASAANTISKLAIGSSTQVLTVTGGVPVWDTPTSGGLTVEQVMMYAAFPLN